MDGENAEPKQLSSFEKYDEFMGYLQTILDRDLFSEVPTTQEEEHAFRWLGLIVSPFDMFNLYNENAYSQCDEYQEQSYLLDPWLDKIIVPPVEALRQYTAKAVTENRDELITSRFFYLCLVIYQIVKTRGYKTIGDEPSCPFEKCIYNAVVPFFPHQVSDLEIVVTFMERRGKQSVRMGNHWAVPYLMYLWLSLICRLPFDLASFDDAGSTAGLTAQKIEQIGKAGLDGAGISRDSAAFLLSRFYTRCVPLDSPFVELTMSRSDTRVLFGSFLSWCEPHLADSSDLFLVFEQSLDSSSTYLWGIGPWIAPHYIRDPQIWWHGPDWTTAYAYA
jgi:hypothetical protein